MKSIRVFILCSVGLALVFTHVGRVWAKAPTTTENSVYVKPRWKQRNLHDESRRKQAG